MRTARAVMLIDGENLTSRFQGMVDEGREPTHPVAHVKDCYVWSPSLTTIIEFDLLRVTYYTSVMGNDEHLHEISAQIAGISFRCCSGTASYQAQVVPRVFKNSARSRKSGNVDINIVLDLMEYASTDAVQMIVLVSGDGDFIPVIESAMRKGNIVYAMALSSGLNRRIPVSVDRFIDLDRSFFKQIPTL